MSGHTAITLAYVRTSAGVVKVEPGRPLPEAALDGEVERLAAAGALKGTPAEKPTIKGRSGAAGQDAGS